MVHGLAIVKLPIFTLINVKNFHGSLTTVVRAQNDTSKTAKSLIPFSTEHTGIAFTSDGVLKIS